jgi:HSP20 family protein
MRVADLIPWKPARGNEPAAHNERNPVAALQNDVNRAFDDFLRMIPVPFAGLRGAFMDNGSGIHVDVSETDKEVIVTAELPGMDEADVDVTVTDGTLVITGEKKTDREVGENGYILRERSFGHIERAVPLPDGIDADAAQARFKNGVLTVSIPRTVEARGSGKHIPVRSH